MVSLSYPPHPVDQGATDMPSEEPIEDPIEEPTIGCGCPTSCTGEEYSG